jgi:hypothetical protein
MTHPDLLKARQKSRSVRCEDILANPYQGAPKDVSAMLFRSTGLRALSRKCIRTGFAVSVSVCRSEITLSVGT